MTSNDENKFEELVEVVRKINVDAAIWLSYNRDNLNFASELNGVMVWGDTPQKHDFWADIENKLNN